MLMVALRYRNLMNRFVAALGNHPRHLTAVIVVFMAAVGWLWLIASVVNDGLAEALMPAMEDYLSAGGLAVGLAMWVAMVFAMMLPTAAPIAARRSLTLCSSPAISAALSASAILFAARAI